jgi:multidrug efflux pump subunit AcrB
MKNAGLIFLAMILIVAGGIYSVSTMKMESLPNVDIPYLSVSAVYPGATPEQVQEDVGKPLEQALSGIKDVKNLYVSSMSNYAHATIEFSMSKKMEEAEREVESALNKVKLPDTVKRPQVSKEGPASDSVFMFAVDGGGADQATVQKFVEERIKPSLSGIEGVAKVEVNGSAEKKLWVKVDPDKLKEHNLTLDKVKQALMANNISAPTGEVTIDGKSMNVQVGKQLKSVEEIQAVQLILVEQDTNGLTDTFKQLGDGMSKLGQGLGDVGKTVGALAKNQAIMGQQIQLMNAIHQLSGEMIQDQQRLAALKGNPQAQQDPQVQGQIAQLEAKIKAEQEQIGKLQGSLAEVSEALKQSSAEGQSYMQSLQSQGSATQSQKPAADGAKMGLTLKTIKLSDIATVTYEVGKQGSMSRLNGQPAVVATVYAAPGANAVEVVKETRKKLDELKMPAGYEVTTLRDASVDVKKSVHSMLREAAYGALLAAIVTLLFLRNLRTTIVALLSIPLSILVTMIVMKGMDYSLNMMTLAGIAVAIGRVVDDSIVVIENLYRRIQLAKDEERDANLVMIATGEVSAAITSSTVTTIAVFGPLAFVPGIVGKFFAPFAWSVVIALAFSLVIAVTVAPLMSKLFLLNLKPVEHRENGLQRGYKKLLIWSLGHKTIVVVVCLALLGGTFALLGQVPQNMFPAEKVTQYRFSANLPIGTSVEKANELAKQVEAVLVETGAVDHYATYVNTGMFNIRIGLKEEADGKAFEQTVREKTKDLGEGVSTALSSSGVPGGTGGMVMVINGPDLETMKKYAKDVQDALKDVPGLADVTSNVEGVRPQVSIVVDDEKAAAAGVNPAMLTGAVRDMISGSTALNVSLNGKSTEVNVGLKVDELNDTAKIAAQSITNMKGEAVRIGDVAKVEKTVGPTSLQRLNQQEYVSVTGKFTDANSSGVQAAVEKKLAELPKPEGVTYYFEGEAKAMQEGFTNMIIAIAVSVVLVYMVMMVAFGEMMAPFAILFSLPFIFVGAIFGLWVTDESLGMPALVGILMLIGIVVTNAIVLIDRVMQNKAKGMDTFEALVEAGVTRIRPILMTAVATVGALVPLAVSSEGGLISRSLAIVVISGLTTSTLLTLVIVPIAYTALDSLREKVFGKNKRAASVTGRPVQEV